MFCYKYVFYSCTVLPDSKENKLRSSYQDASPLVGKHTTIVSMPCCAWKCVHTAISGNAAITKVPGCHLLQQMSS